MCRGETLILFSNTMITAVCQHYVLIVLALICCQNQQPLAGIPSLLSSLLPPLPSFLPSSLSSPLLPSSGGKKHPLLALISAQAEKVASMNPHQNCNRLKLICTNNNV